MTAVFLFEGCIPSFQKPLQDGGGRVGSDDAPCVSGSNKRSELKGSKEEVAVSKGEKSHRRESRYDDWPLRSGVFTSELLFLWAPSPLPPPSGQMLRSHRARQPQRGGGGGGHQIRTFRTEGKNPIET